MNILVMFRCRFQDRGSRNGLAGEAETNDEAAEAHIVEGSRKTDARFRSGERYPLAPTRAVMRMSLGRVTLCW